MMQTHAFGQRMEIEQPLARVRYRCEAVIHQQNLNDGSGRVARVACSAGFSGGINRSNGCAVAFTNDGLWRRFQPVDNRVNQDKFGIPIALIHHLGRTTQPKKAGSI